MKKCPFCAEEIQDEAIVCKHCGRDLRPGVTPPPASPQQITVQSKEGCFLQTLNTGCVVLALLLLLPATFCFFGMIGRDAAPIRPDPNPSPIPPVSMGPRPPTRPRATPSSPRQQRVQPRQPESGR